MPTSVHIPGELLKKADKRAKQLGISRNRLIVNAIERELQSGVEWPKEFLDELRNVDEQGVQAVDEMTSVIRKNRRSKPPRQF
ncbi:MAG TPA: hypothetical protein VGI40_25185 [Pirellulaceae bacterium]|jgi:hypothetical protein